MLSEPLTPAQIQNLGMLTLASVGDCVYDLMVRARLCAEGTARARALHKSRVARVNARSQAEASARILEFLTEEEADIFRRGRNTRTGSQPKNASRGEYQTATALEALLGWLYLLGREERLRELFERLENNE